MEGLRRAGIQAFIAHGLLARAALYRVSGNFDQAQRDLEEAMAIAERGSMRLYEADARLEYARLHLATGEGDSARQSLDATRNMIAEMGYHRRDGEVQELEQRLAAQEPEMPDHRRVLVVDPDSETMDKMTATLEGDAYIVTGTQSDGVALDLAQSSEFDALVISSGVPLSGPRIPDESRPRPPSRHRRRHRPGSPISAHPAPGRRSKKRTARRSGSEIRGVQRGEAPMPGV